LCNCYTLSHFLLSIPYSCAFGKKIGVDHLSSTYPLLFFFMIHGVVCCPCWLISSMNLIFVILISIYYHPYNFPIWTFILKFLLIDGPIKLVIHFHAQKQFFPLFFFIYRHDFPIHNNDISNSSMQKLLKIVISEATIWFMPHYKNIFSNKTN
jgi:hypothetical protein